MSGQNQAKLHEEILTIFRITVDDVERVKQWQWRLFLQSAAAQGAIFALYATFAGVFPSLLLRAIFVAISINLCAAACYYLRQSAVALEEMRARFPKCREHFEAKADAILGPPTPATKPRIHRMLIAILAVASLSVCLLVVFSRPRPVRIAAELRTTAEKVSATFRAWFSADPHTGRWTDRVEGER